MEKRGNSREFAEICGKSGKNVNKLGISGKNVNKLTTSEKNVSRQVAAVFIGCYCCLGRLVNLREAREWFGGKK